MSTSRVGRKPVVIPSGVKIEVVNQQVIVQGAKGKLTIPLHQNVLLDIADGQVKVSSHAEGMYLPGNGSKLVKSIAGTTRAKIFNMVTGVTTGFERKLLLVGVGYKAQAKGAVLGLTVGYSHPVEIKIPEGITVETPIPTEIIVKGMDKHLVGHTAAMIRAVREPEPYKGKGIRYANEVIVRKETKKK
jgi:large subunit ribosomal protein L6